MGALSNIDPTAVAVWASAVVLFALIAVLRAVFKLNFSLLTVLALGLGIALSLVFDGQVDSLNLLGNIYINLITALVAPLIFVSIISSITYVGSLKKLRSIGLRSVGWLLLTNLIAIVMTLGVAIPLHIGSGGKLLDDEAAPGATTSEPASRPPVSSPRRQRRSTRSYSTSSRRTSSETCPATVWCPSSSRPPCWPSPSCRSVGRRT